jgi:purine catabolism regulator
MSDLSIMSLTVADALTIYPLSEGRLIAGAGGVSRVLRSVNVMDCPDIADWINPGDMLFTTAYIFKDSPGEAVKLLQKLADREAAGLGVKVGRFWSQIPEELIEEADRLQFPLIELPFQFAFSDQMSALFRTEFQKKTKTMRMIMEKQRRLMQFALRHERGDIFHALADILGHPVAVIGSRGHILHRSGSWSEARLLKGWPWETEFHWVNTMDGRVCRIPLMHDGDCCGYLLVMPETWEAAKLEEGLFQQAAEILSFYMSSDYLGSLDHSALDELETVLNRYLQKKVPLDYFMDHAEKCGLSFLSDSYQCVLTSIVEKDERSRKDLMLKQVRQELQYHPKLRKLNGRHFFVDEGLLSVYSVPLQEVERVDEVAHLLSNHFYADTAMNGASPRFFISTIKAGPEALREAFEECVETRRLAERFTLSETVLRFDTVQFVYLFEYVPVERMKRFCNYMLKPLLQKEDCSQMIRTLEVFVENDGQINETARQLYLHRNTVAYRLEKISDLLQVDLKKTDDLLRLRLVFMFRSFLDYGQGWDVR